MTSFQKRVYEVVREIPPGKVLTYGEVAKKIGYPKDYRAVGNILNKNKDKRILCHRVIKSDGRVGGYKYGINRKINLLKKEGLIIKNGKIASRFRK